MTEAAGLRVLVVDDEPDMCWVLETGLKADGHVVTTVTRGREALELLAAEPYAVALVDAKLGDMNGTDLILSISRESPQTAVILISGYYNREDRAIQESLRRNLCVGFVAKPFNMSEIRRTMRQALVDEGESKRAGSHTAG